MEKKITLWYYIYKSNNGVIITISNSVTAEMKSHLILLAPGCTGEPFGSIRLRTEALYYKEEKTTETTKI